MYVLVLALDFTPIPTPLYSVHVLFLMVDVLCCVEASLKLFKRFGSRTYIDINLNRTNDALDHDVKIIVYFPPFGIYELKLGIYCRFGTKTIRFVIY